MFVKKLLLSCASFGVFANGVFAKEVDMSNQANLQSLFPNSYGAIKLKNYSQDKNLWQGKITVGSTFWDEKLNLRAVFGTEKYQGTVALKDRGTRLISELEAYSNDFWTATPYAQVWFQGEEKGRAVHLGVSNMISWDAETGAGTFALSLRHDISMELGSKEGSVTVTEKGKVVKTGDMSSAEQKRFGLTAEEKTGVLTANASSPSLAHNIEASMSLAVAAVPGMSVTLGAQYDQDLVPNMTRDQKANKVETTRSGFLNLPDYTTNSKTYGVIGAKYDWTDNLYVSVSSYVDAKETNGTRGMLVISSVGMELF